MSMNTIQHQIDEFIQSNQLEISPHFRLLDLVSELGEVAKEMLKATDYGEKPFMPSPEQHATWSEEIADALFALVSIANSTNVDLQTALETVLDKYQQRIDNSGSAGSDSEG